MEKKNCLYCTHFGSARVSNNPGAVYCYREVNSRTQELIHGFARTHLLQGIPAVSPSLAEQCPFYARAEENFIVLRLAHHPEMQEALAA
ncbi:MAG: hypothetical protein AABX66_00260 [Nanoarchaeota archaeon]